MDGMRGIADQRQPVGGKLTGIAARSAGKLRSLASWQRPKAIIERDIQRLVEGGFISLLHRCASPAIATRRSSTGADR